MVPMAQWAVVIPAEQWATERLFQHDTLTVPGTPGVTPEPGDEVLMLAGDAEPRAVAVGTVLAERSDALLLSYRRRAFDEAAPAADLKLTEAVTALPAETFQRLTERLGGDPDRQTWLVSLSLPIEAGSPAEAVRQFWTYVQELGPAELPAFVSPSGDELAMQAFVLGAEANQDPEEDED
jgi:hypothetical protein